MKAILASLSSKQKRIIQNFDERVVCAIIAVLVTLGINTGSSLVVGAESNSFILNFISKLSQSIGTTNIVDLTTFGCVYCAARYVRKHKKQVDIIGIVVAFLLSYLYTWSFSYKDNSDTYILFANTFQTFQTMIRVLGYAGLFYYSYELVYTVFVTSAQSTKKGSAFPSSRKLFFFSSVIIFLSWMIYILLGYPGSVAGDAIGQLNQFFYGEFNTHHPPLSTVLMGAFVSFGVTIGNGAIGIFLYLVFQTVICSIIIGFSACKIHRLGLNRKWCYFFVSLFAFLPIFGMYAQYFEKDMLYSIFTLLFMITAVGIVLEKKSGFRSALVCFAVGILCCFLRNNGIYAVVPLYLIIAFVCKKNKERGVYFVFGALTIGVYVLFNAIAVPALSIEPGNIREALSIPMQQSARYIRDYNFDVSDEELSAMELFFENYEEVADTYEPPCADEIKSMVIIEKKNLPRYFRSWATMGLRHPECYHHAFMCLNYGYLAPNEQNVEPSPSSDLVLEQLSNLGIDGSQNETGLGILSSLSFINVIFPFLRYFTMPGFYTWLVIILTAIQIKQRLYRTIILMIPNYINIAVCLASPLCNGLRYELPVVLSIPIMIAATYNQISLSQRATE